MNLEARHVSYAYVPGQRVLRDTSLSVGPGDAVFVLGANGSGKTTLLDCLIGLRRPQEGIVLLDGDDLQRIPPRERARRIGLVPQIHEPVFAYTVGEIVLMGRAPHLGLFARPGKRDQDAVHRALEAVELRSLRDRPYTETSGGERQRALIARGLAQGAACLLMDEPAAHLDPHHQADVFAAVSRLSSEGFSFVIASHQPNHALLYANRVVFLIDGETKVQGPPETVVTPETLRLAYGMAFEIVRGAHGTRAVIPK